jgi:hypothetical protein
LAIAARAAFQQQACQACRMSWCRPTENRLEAAFRTKVEAICSIIFNSVLPAKRV